MATSPPTQPARNAPYGCNIKSAVAPTITPPGSPANYQVSPLTVTCECGVLDIHSLEPPPRPEYCRGYEGADGGGEEGDVGVDVGPGHGDVVRMVRPQAVTRVNKLRLSDWTCPSLPLKCMKEF